MTIAGMRGYNGLLAILNATNEDFQSLYASINNCNGAAERMAKVKLDNLNGDIVYTDDADDLADDLKIQIQDRDKVWLQKWLTEAVEAAAGGKLSISAVIRPENWKKKGTLKTGAFELDSVDASGPPATVTINSTSLAFSNDLRQTKKSKAWKNYNLSGIASEIAGNGGLSCQYEASTNPSYDRVEQTRQSDIEFLRKLCQDAGISIKVTDGKLVNNNRAPAVSCDTASGSDLGTKDAGFSIPYSVNDEDGDPVTVTEAIDGVTLRTFSANLGGNNTFAVTGDTFFKLLNGAHTLTASATDGRATTTHKLTFTKEVTEATITLAEPMAADDKITICVLSVAGDIPADADYTVEVTNNGNDDAPVWEDCTMEVRNGGNHVFENETAANGFAFNFRVSAKRGPSGQGGYISSVQGGFQ